MTYVTLDDIKTLLKEQTVELENEIKTNVKHIHQNIEQTIKKLEIVEKQSIFLECKIRKYNIIIFGLNLQDTNLPEAILLKLNELLGLKLKLNDINNVYKLHKNPNSPIIVEFISFLKKLEIYQNEGKLRNLKELKISISNDLCHRDQKDQKILRQHLKQAREENKTARIRGNRIEIEGNWFTVEDLEKNESDVGTDSAEDSDPDSEEDKRGKNTTSESRQPDKTAEATEVKKRQKSNSSPKERIITRNKKK
ncbi:unnamed protein product [Phaedon cochleariae]|uniref:Endonuclease-reverse transcriptase n=1 Tax=Phaedon cochleariae TaxID=80249 RepID=A0A9N9SL97_PHACE|nr:unnamed protein product [Phaedon cochleariae]